MTDSISLSAGGLDFIVEYRHFGGDQGTAIRVHHEGEQVLRFDCFVDDPHYHLHPSGPDRRIHLNKAEVPDAEQWTLGQIRSHLPDLLREAGLAEVADKVDADAIPPIIDQLATAIQQVKP